MVQVLLINQFFERPKFAQNKTLAKVRFRDVSTFVSVLKRPKKDAEHISTCPGAGISLFNFLKEVANMSLIFLSLCFFNEALLIIPLNIAK